MAVSLLHISDFIDFSDKKFLYYNGSYDKFTLGSDLHNLILHNLDFDKINDQLKGKGPVFLTHPDNDILNLPWENILNISTQDNYQDIFFRTHAEFFENTEFNVFGPPLRVLVMISSPEDSAPDLILNFEEEELKLLKALEPFIINGSVELEFTESAVFEDLLKKLDEKQYHILHVSGHGKYVDTLRSHYALLEDPSTFNEIKVFDVRFEEINRCRYPVPLVFMSVCESAKGYKNIAECFGLANRLLDSGTTAILAMSSEIDDIWCSCFTSHFYGELLGGNELGGAFSKALHLTKGEEEFSGERYIKQEFIPVLYTSKPLRLLVDFKTQVSDQVSVKPAEVFRIGQRAENFRFLGRRVIVRKAIHQIGNNNCVHFIGQGGTGKTCTAEYLVQRLSSANKKTEPILINESNAGNIFSIYSAVEKLLKEKYSFEQTLLSLKQEKGDWMIAQTLSLIKELAVKCTPLFVFDNLESLQTDYNGPLKPEYEWLNSFIRKLLTIENTKVILTSRYPLDFLNLNHASVISLTSASKADFIKKINESGLNAILQFFSLVKGRCTKSKNGELYFSNIPARTPISFIDLTDYLHDRLGGNYRALELFLKLLGNQYDLLMSLKVSLNEFEEKTYDIFNTVLSELTTNLIFDVIWDKFQEQEKSIICSLSKFNLPVEEKALVLQGYDQETVSNALQKAKDLTLVEYYPGKGYYVTPLTGEMIVSNKSAPLIHFNDQGAGTYYWNFVVHGKAFYEFLKDPVSLIKSIGDLHGELLELVGDLSRKVYNIVFLELTNKSKGKDDDAELTAIIMKIDHFFYNQPVNFFIEAFNHFKKANDYEALDNIASTICSFYSLRDFNYYKVVYWASLTQEALSPKPISVELLHLYGAALIYMNTDLDQARNCYTEILSRENAGDYMFAQAHLHIAEIDLMEGKYNVALKKLLFCKEKYKNELQPAMHLLYALLGWAYSDLNDLQNAEKCYLQALDICNNNQSVPSTQISSIYQHLGDLQMRLAREIIGTYRAEILEKTRFYFQMAIKATENLTMLTTARFKMGKVCFLLEQSELAEHHARIALALAIQTNNRQVEHEARELLNRIIKNRNT